MSSKNEVFEYLIDQLRQQVNNNQCEDQAHEVQSLKNQLRDASVLVAELQRELAFVAGDASEYIAAEQSGCRKEDTQKCKHEWEVKKYPWGYETYEYCPLCREVRQ